MSILRETLRSFNPDTIYQPASAVRVDVIEIENELPMHRHIKGQLVVALRGGVTCEVTDGLWMVPPRCGVWVPGGMLHSNRVTANGRLCFLYVDPAAATLPDACCTLSLTPLLIDLIERLATLPRVYDIHGPSGRLVTVLLDELSQMRIERLHLPISADARLRSIVNAITINPADRSTAAEWGARLAMSERTLTRLVLQETGMSFGRWRRQLHIIVALQRLSEKASVQRVAEDLGYESVSAFITMFKKALGSTPARYFSGKE